MQTLFGTVYQQRDEGISGAEMTRMVDQSLMMMDSALTVLLVPPDITRMHSRAGELCALYYQRFVRMGASVSVLPALGTHAPMTPRQLDMMFPGIPHDKFLRHDWRGGIDTLGEVPEDLIYELSEGKLRYPIRAQLSRYVTRGDFDLILCLGQVVPHEVAGMSSHLKHVFVGLGGQEMIDRTHFLGAVYGAERVMGRFDSPVRQVFDWAGEAFLEDYPIAYALTVIGEHEGCDVLKGLFIGPGKQGYEQAMCLSEQVNITRVGKPIDKAVVYLDPDEYHSTWLGNKSVYRTRMALAPGASLLVLAPGVKCCGEDPQNDAIIRKYGYCGRQAVLSEVARGRELARHLSAAAHLIHGSSDGKFEITYATSKLSEMEVRAVHYRWMAYDKAARLYPPDQLREGFQTLDSGETIYYIRNPALGLWM